MKKLYFLCMLLAMSIVWACTTDTPDEIKKSGSIAGSVSDRTTGEPISAVSVTIEPGGASTVTGTDGSFTFRNLEIGSYTLTAKKEGYKENSSTVSVRAGEPISAHMLIERIPDIVTADRDLLDYGDNPSTNTLSFNIVNAGFENLTWEIEEHCEWITEVKPEKGTLAYGKTEAIVVVIDRDLLAAGNNEAVIVIKSSKGSSEVKVVAVGAERFTPALNTLEATDITSQSAKLNAEITNPGEPPYTERGFVYSLNSMPTFDNMLAKLTAPVNEETKYSYSLNGLTLGKKYYVRAYAINSVGTAYSTNEISFTPIAHSPELTIQPATDLNVTKASATLNGTVVKEGDPAYFERGFVYSTESTPTVNNVKQKANSVSKKTTNTRLSRLESANHSALGSYANNKFDLGLATNSNLSSVTVKANGTGTGTFRINVTGLELNKRYYVRAYAICKVNDSEVIVYSKEETTFTLATTDPKISVQAPSNINVPAATATLNGTVTDCGDPKYFERGFVYGTSSNPTVDNTKVKANGTGLGTFSANISNLKLNQTYYVRAYAISKIGETESIVYSPEQVTLSLSPTAPAVTVEEVTNINVSAATATLNGTVTDCGDPKYFERGFVYGTSSNPTVDNTKVKANGTGLGAFSVNIANLKLSQTYYVRAYAISKIGETESIVYSPEQVTLSLSPTAPAVAVEEVTNINVSAGTATFNGNITTVGTPAYTERGFVYGVTRNPTVSDTKLVATGSGAGKYSVNVSNLEVNKTYYLRAYAIGSTGVVYSPTDKTFSLTTTAPSISIQATSNINVSAGTATLNGTVVSVGNPAYSERGFVYAMAPNPTVDDTKVKTTGTGTGTFTANISGLKVSQTYYARTYAIYKIGTTEHIVYSPTQDTFTLSPTAPSVSVGEVTNINILAGTATLNGTIVNAGVPQYTERGFVYGFTRNPTISDTKVISTGSGTGAFSVNISNLEMNKTYYVRSYVVGASGTVYSSSDVSFCLSTEAPEIVMYNTTKISVTNRSATLYGSITSAGKPAYTERGFVYSTVGTPTINDTKLKVSGTGTGAFSANLSNLELNTTYYARAYVIHYVGEEERIIYSSYQAKFKLIPTGPEIRLDGITDVDITKGTAIFHAEIINVGEPSYTTKGFVYALHSTPTLSDEHVEVNGTSAGKYNANITGLAFDKTYYVRAYATNITGTVYSSSLTFTTNSVLPKVSTSDVISFDIKAGTATFRGKIISAGEPLYTERGFTYGSTQQPSANDKKIVVEGSGITGDFTVNATNLPTGSYYVRAYAKSDRYGIVYGNSVMVSSEWVSLPSAGLFVQSSDLGFINSTNPKNGNQMCTNSKIGDYNDWRLPNSTELSAIYNNRNSISGFIVNKELAPYMSSSYSHTGFAYVINFGTKDPGKEINTYDWDSQTNNAEKTFYVRCVRTAK